MTTYLINAPTAIILGALMNPGADKDCLRYGHNAKPGEWCPHCGKHFQQEDDADERQAEGAR